MYAYWPLDSPANIKGALKGMAFGNKLAALMNRYVPGMVKAGIRNLAVSYQKNPDRFLDGVVVQMAAPDQRLMQDYAVRKAIQRDFAEAYRQGGDGHMEDSFLAMSNGSWGFDLANVSVPVHLWER